MGDNKNVVVYWLDLQVNELDKLYKIVVALYDSRLNILVATPIDTKDFLEIADEVRKLERKGYREAEGKEEEYAMQKTLEDCVKEVFQ